MSYLPRAVAPNHGRARQRSIDGLNERLRAEYRVILACATHCDAMQRNGLNALVDVQASTVLENAQDIVTQIQSLGGTPVYQIKEFRIQSLPGA